MTTCWREAGVSPIHERGCRRDQEATRRIRFCINDAVVRQPHSAHARRPRALLSASPPARSFVSGSMCVSAAGREGVCVVGLIQGGGKEQASQLPNLSCDCQALQMCLLHGLNIDHPQPFPGSGPARGGPITRDGGRRERGVGYPVPAPAPRSHPRLIGLNQDQILEAWEGGAGGGLGPQ